MTENIVIYNSDNGNYFKAKISQPVVKSIKNNPRILYDSSFQMIMDDFIKNHKSNIKIKSDLALSLIKSTKIEFLCANPKVKILNVEGLCSNIKQPDLTLGELKNFILKYNDDNKCNVLLKFKFFSNIRKFLETWLLFYDHAVFDNKTKGYYKENIKEWKDLFDSLNFLYPNRKLHKDCVLSKIWNQKKEKIVLNSTNDEPQNLLKNFAICKNKSIQWNVSHKYDNGLYWFDIKGKTLNFIFDEKLKIHC
jgi:hypothetical protein